jgi:hypothetical protein
MRSSSVRSITARLVVPCAVLVAICGAHAAQRTGIVGEWEYRQTNSASATGFDREGERLVFREAAGGRLTAEYYGLERAGEHGLFYTAVEATEVATGPDGTVRLTVPPRRLFRARPRTLNDAARLESAGATKDELVLTGRINKDVLEMTCSGAAGSCPDSRMTFRRR